MMASAMTDQDRILKHQDFPIARLFEMAAADQDPASAMVLVDSDLDPDAVDGAVVIIKGREPVLMFMRWAESVGLMTPNTGLDGGPPREHDCDLNPVGGDPTDRYLPELRERDDVPDKHRDHGLRLCIPATDRERALLAELIDIRERLAVDWDITGLGNITSAGLAARVRLATGK